MTEHKLAALMKFLEVEDKDAIDVPDDDNADPFEYGSESYLVLADDEAQQRAKDSMMETLWAFNVSFLASYVPALGDARVQKTWTKMIGELCEDANPLVEAMLGDRLEEFMDDAIATDGRGHFMNTYDGREEEVRVTDVRDGKDYTFYVYRV